MVLGVSEKSVRLLETEVVSSADSPPGFRAPLSCLLVMWPCLSDFVSWGLSALLLKSHGHPLQVMRGFVGRCMQSSQPVYDKLRTAAPVFPEHLLNAEHEVSVHSHFICGARDMSAEQVLCLALICKFVSATIQIHCLIFTQ